MINGISVAALSELANEVKEDPSQAKATFDVAVKWQTGTRGEAQTRTMTLGGHRISRNFSFLVDEPRQLGGLNHGPSPAELLLSSVGSCLMVTYAVGASVMGVQLDTLEIDVSGVMDLRGFLKTDPSVPAAFERIDYKVTVAGDGTREQLEFLHRQVMERSPNRMTVASGVPLNGELEILSEVDSPRSASVDIADALPPRTARV